MTEQETPRTASDTTPSTSASRRLLSILPLLIVIALSALFLMRLGAGDSSKLPSTLIGKPAPHLTLPGLSGQSGLDNADLQQGHVTIVNIFASWCEPCRAEHDYLLALSKDPDLRKNGVTLIGVANKDGEKTVMKFLESLGNPYSKIGFDLNNRAGIDWGVYGIPETFIIRGDGIVSYKFIGPMDEKSLTTVIKPEIQKAITATVRP
jgi:cytochrome c biogenesis protein CcmG, thiol:disulfide interchange protein DsbE